MNFKQSLDRYLTTPYDDGFDGWIESVIDVIPEPVYLSNEEWFDSGDGLCNDWLNKLFKKNLDFEDAARIIERAFRIYIKGQ